MTVATAPKPAVDPAAREQYLKYLEELRQSEARRKLVIKYAKTNEQAPGKGGPYPWAVAFHEAGRDYRFRALIAANRVGKTYSAAAEVACHLTGLYPEWWTGRRFTKPVEVWVAGTSNQDVRDIQQRELLGLVEEGRRPSGEGWIPNHLIGQFSFRQCGVSNVIDTVQVKHVSGGWSSLGFRSFEQGDIAFQGTAKHLIWLDEEPENDPNNKIFGECNMRLMTTDGMLIFTRTPLLGPTAIVRHFMSGAKGTWYKNVTWDDAPHLSDKIKAEFLANTPEHQRDARSKGIPALGTGAVYKVAQSEYRCEAIPIPDHYRRIAGIDFGIDHPAAAVWIAHDADADVVYVYDCYRASGQTPVYHAERLKSAGKYIPVAWPADGLQRGKADGVPLSEQYRKHGVNMTELSARFADDKGGGQSREASVGDILERMRTGKLKVFANCTDLLEELRMLHRDDNGKIKPVRDDLESAMRYALMCLRWAVSKRQSDIPMQHQAADLHTYDPLAAFSRS